VKVEIRFLEERVYDDSFFKQFDELVLPLNDAVELVNSGCAVVTYIYDK
jgi:hypothetical protein